ncbi:MAG: amidinotransferase [Chloroflexi bacterium]|nr:amidinotransferase [Chloroflexota bacterium]
MKVETTMTVKLKTHHTEWAQPALLMCPPTFYAVEYEINPWMKRREAVDGTKARRQWYTLFRVLSEDIGATVELARPLPGLPDFVFAANSGLVLDGLVIPSRFRYPERSAEEQHWRAWFEVHDYGSYEIPLGLYFEGEGDVLVCGDLLVAGFGFRSDREAVQRVSELLEKEALILQLANPWFYHLDTCFCPLNRETVLYVPQAFTEASRRAITQRFPDAIPVPENEAHRFACNSIVLGRHVVMSPECPVTGQELKMRGYMVHEVEVSEFLKAGGGAKCLALFLERAESTTEKVETGERTGVSANRGSV